MTDRILVTGASGFIGKHLAPALHERGYEVVTHSSRDGDIAQCALKFSDIKHVFHLAARTFVPDSWTNPWLFYRTNVLGTVNVLEFCRRNGAFATLLSSYVYGEPQSLPIREDHPLQAFNPYSHTKILAEEIGRYYQQQFDVPVTIVRAFNVYGPGQRADFLIPFLLQQALDPGLDVISVADPRPKRDYLNVRDLVDLLCRLVEHPGSATYNAGSGISFSVEEVVSVIRTLGLPFKPLESKEQLRAGEVLDVVADVSKAQRDLGWTPQIALEDGLSELVSLSRRESTR